MRYLFKAWPDFKGDVDENSSDVAFFNFTQYPWQPAHCLCGDVIIWIFLIIHPCHHGWQYSGGIFLNLFKSEMKIKLNTEYVVKITMAKYWNNPTPPEVKKLVWIAYWVCDTWFQVNTLLMGNTICKINKLIVGRGVARTKRKIMHNNCEVNGAGLGQNPGRGRGKSKSWETEPW